MIDKQVLKKFVVGLGSDLEVDLCESYLKDCDAAGSDSVLNLQLDQETKSDSLIQSLRNSGEELKPCEEVANEIQTCIHARLETTDIVKFVRPPESNDEIGRIGPYRLLEKIGAGGMGIVFRAENIESGSVVALKVMNPMMASNPLAAERFQREVRSAAKLDHARIIKIHDIGRDAGIPFFAMELLQGRPLGRHIEQRGRLPASEVKQLVTQIAEGLDYASQHGILHRDIKPDNLWLTDEGDVIILDFGLARGKDDTAGLTNTGDVLGTPRYMAPEQIKGQSTDHRTDLFSLGSVMYEMLTGASKFADENVYASMMAVTQRAATPDELTALGVPAPLAKLTCKLLAKEPDGRPESAALVIQELEEMDLSLSIHTEKLGSQAGTNWPKYMAILFGVPLFIALAIFIYIQTDRGTLVIEAEPGVEITTEDGGVAKIRLVDSDKTYNISVGTRVLPSGSYEIVVDDESDEFSFSTPQFVIRRGQQELVKISLKQVDANKQVDAEMAETQDEEIYFHSFDRKTLSGLQAALTDDEYQLFTAVYGPNQAVKITPEGGDYLEPVPDLIRDAAQQLSMTEDELEQKLVPLRKKLSDFFVRQANALDQKYADAAKFFESNPEFFDERISGLAVVEETDGRDFVFKIDAGIDKVGDGFEIHGLSSYYSFRDMFRSPLQIIRAGKIIGEAQLLDDLPLKEGEQQPDTYYIGRLDQSETDDVFLQSKDIVVVRRIREPGPPYKWERLDNPEYHNPVPDPTIPGMIVNRPIVRPNPWNQKRKEKEFLAEQFPGVDQFFIGSADYVSDNFVRLHIGSKLSPSVFNSGLDQVPYLKGKKAYLYDGVERIGDGKVTGLLGMGRDNFVEIQDPLTAWPRFRCPTIVIPVKDFPRDNPDRADPTWKANPASAHRQR